MSGYKRERFATPTQQVGAAGNDGDVSDWFKKTWHRRN